jgi:ribA/ribD-fused uncharacterized protein
MNQEHETPGVGVIRFYQVGAPYAEFSNMSPHPIVVEGVVWPTTEHYFQAQKFPGSPLQESIRKAKSPMIAAWLGNNRNYPLRPDWESAKEGIMRQAMRAKFTQHQGLRAVLLSTGNAELIEHTGNDGYWSDGGDGTGQNMLGKILMEIRQELRAAPSAQSA